MGVLSFPNRQKAAKQRLSGDDVLNGKDGVISSNLISGSKQTASESL